MPDVPPAARRLRLLSLCAVGLLASSVALGGCRDATALTAEPAPPAPTVAPRIAPAVKATRGEIVERVDGTGFFDDPAGTIGQAVRATYRSVSGLDGRTREVSGVFMIPRGDPPPGGWRIVSMAHGTTGIGAGCGPSREHTLMGYLPAVMAYLEQGYAVAMTDYEGLGAPGSHPYLEPRTEAFNVIDAVRALRELFPNSSAEWVSFGNSQGGQAAWAANEAADWYGEGLHLVGTVALSPAANATPLADLAYARALTADQRAAAPLLIAGLARFNPELASHSPLNEFSPAQLDAMFACDPDGGPLRDQLLPHDPMGIDDAVAASRLRDALRRVALPEAPLSAPMLVINGLNDDVIAPSWISAAAADSCALGGVIDHLEVPGAGHGDLGEKAYDTVASWVRDRFDHKPAPSTCGAPARILS